MLPRRNNPTPLKDTVVGLNDDNKPNLQDIKVVS